MDRNGVARKSVENERIEVLIGLALERQAGVAVHDLDSGFRVAEKSESRTRDRLHERGDFVEAVRVAGLAVSRNGADAKPHRTHSPPRRAASEHEPDTPVA